MTKQELISAIMLAKQNLQVAKDNCTSLLTDQFTEEVETIDAKEFVNLTEEQLTQLLRSTLAETYNQLVATKGVIKDKSIKEEMSENAKMFK